MYGEPRLTKDIDITIGVDIDKIELVLDLVNNIELLPLPENIKDFVEKTFIKFAEQAKVSCSIHKLLQLLH